MTQEAPVPPQSPEAEESIIGAMMLSPKAIAKVRKIIEPGDFYRESNGRIFTAALALHDRREPVDALTLVAELERTGRLEGVGGRARIYELAALVPTAANASHYAGLVREAATLRKLITTGGEIARLGWEGGGDVDGLVRRARGLMAGVHGRASTLGVLSMSQVIEKEIARQEDPSFRPVSLGFGSLDREIGGIAMGQVATTGARAGVGKTSLKATITHWLTARNDCGILVCSLEMPDVEWARKAVAIHADVTPDEVRDWFKQRDRSRFSDFESRQRNVRITDRPLKLEQISDAIAEANETLDAQVRAVVIDYMGLISGVGKDTYERVSHVARGLKILAKQEQVAVFVAVQLSRAAGDGSIPVSLDMLRDSGAIEESADYLLGLWRPGKDPKLDSEKRGDLRDVLTVKILKNRNGPDGAQVDLRFSPSRRVYEEAAPANMSVEPDWRELVDEDAA